MERKASFFFLSSFVKALSKLSAGLWLEATIVIFRYIIFSQRCLQILILCFSDHLWVFLDGCGWSRTLCLLLPFAVFTNEEYILRFDLLRHITAGINLYTARKGRYELNKVRIIQKLATSGI